MLRAIIAVCVVILRTEMYSRCSHLVRCNKQQTCSLTVSQCHPAYLLLRAVFLGFDIILALSSYGTAINGRQTGFLTVAIAIPRSASEPRQMLHAGRHFQTEAQLGQYSTSLRRTYKGIGHDGTVGTYYEVRIHFKCRTVLACIGSVHRHSSRTAVISTLDACRITLCSQLTQTHVVPTLTAASVIVRRQTEGI